MRLLVLEMKYWGCSRDGAFEDCRVSRIFLGLRLGCFRRAGLGDAPQTAELDLDTHLRIRHM